MNSKVKVALVGIAGYGDSYLNAMLNTPRDSFELVGVVDPMPQRCKRLGELSARRVPIHADLPSLFSAGRPELVMMATPIHLHAAQTCWCLEQGADVLCEKPLAATVKDARRMISAEQMTGRFAAIGYQWSFSKTIQSLKRDIHAGEFGRPIRLKTIIFFPRGLDYFSRNNWVGRIRTADGQPVYDSPANNAAAHYLHNMLYLLGPTRETSAMPVSVQAELYRANDIENYDTAMIRCRMSGGAELLFYATHCVPAKLGPICRYEFEDATIFYEAESTPGFLVRFRNGRIRRYGEPNLERDQKLWQCIEATCTRKPVACGTRGALPHTVCVAAAQKSMPRIGTFPESFVSREPAGDTSIVCVNGLHAAMIQCYDQGILPFEHGGLEWARPAAVVPIGESAATEDASTSQNARSLDTHRVGTLPV